LAEFSDASPRFFHIFELSPAAASSACLRHRQFDATPRFRHAKKQQLLSAAEALQPYFPLALPVASPPESIPENSGNQHQEATMSGSTQIPAADAVKFFKGMDIAVQSARTVKAKGADGIERDTVEIKNRALSEDGILAAVDLGNRVSIVTIDGKRYEAAKK